MERVETPYERNNKKKLTQKNHKPKDEDESEMSDSEDLDRKIEVKERPDLLHENFVILAEMGRGAFGHIYLTYNSRDNEEVALKKEMKKMKNISPQLSTEFKVLKTLLHIQTTAPALPNQQPYQIDLSGKQKIQQEEILGFPKFHGYGEHADFYYLILQLLGPNLIELFNYCGNRKYTLTTTSMIALQMLNRVEYLHKNHYLHRDIKPENFLIGCGDKSNIVYLIDYGLCKKYKDPKTHQHIPYRENRNLTGTARYVSINTHLGIEQSRRDDLESIGYVIVFFLKGNLPWQGLKSHIDKYNKIMEKKLQIPTEILCYGLPDEIAHYVNYCKSLRFEDRPDYDYLRSLFIKILTTCINTYSLTKDQLKFDWAFDDPSTVFNVKYN
jgi:casein kinase I family protein HRR25